MKILLIYPGLVEGFGSYYNGSDWFNHGLGIISAILKQEGHTVDYLDCRKLHGWDEVAQRINTMEFEMAMISVATVDFEPSKKIAAIIKAKDPNLKIMVGGPHPTLMTEQTAEVKEFDYIFTHEAEVSLPRILNDFPNIPRIIRGEMPTDLDSLPFVDRSLAPEGETPWFTGFKQPYFAITASRGCLYNCSFCQPAERAVFGHKVRKRSVDNILDELEYLSREYGMQSFLIHDDCFTQYTSWAEEFCEKKKQRGLNQPFACQSRADIICKHPDLMQKLVDAGLRWVLIGFESGSDRVLKYIRKGTTVEQNLKAAQICKELGIKIFANYMFGLPTETNEEMRQTAEMIRQIKPDHHSPSVFTPAPGSDLYNYCAENDLILINSSEGYRRNAGSGAKIKGVDYNYIEQMVELSMKPVKVSVCIPTYNYGRFIGDAIDSVLSQTFTDFELIVVDNCSTDNTREIVEKYVALDKRIKYIRNDENIGMVQNWNRCIQYAAGEYIKILCADDVLKPTSLEKSVRILDNFPGVSVVTSARTIVTKDLRPQSILTYFNKSTIIPGQDIIRVCLAMDMTNVIGEPTAVLFRNKDAKRGFDTRYKQIVDLEMWLDLLERGTLAYIHEELCMIRQHESQVTHENLKDPITVINDKSLMRNKYMEKPYLFTASQSSNEVHQNFTFKYKVSIIIPTYNNATYTEKCLRALSENTPEGLYEVIIVDNASRDETPELLAVLDGDVKVLRNDTNLGSAHACNQGAAVAEGEFLLFLHSDTEPLAGWLEPMLKAAAQKEVGIVGSRLIYPDQTIQHAGMVFALHPEVHAIIPYYIYHKAPSNTPQVLKSREFQCITGASLLISSQLFNEVGGFDEAYHNGWEDIDLCMKVRQAGKKVFYEADSLLIHHETVPGLERTLAESRNRRLFLSRWGDFVKEDAPLYYKEDSLPYTPFAS